MQMLGAWEAGRRACGLTVFRVVLLLVTLLVVSLARAQETNGHGIVARPDLWTSVLDAYLKRQGLANEER